MSLKYIIQGIYLISQQVTVLKAMSKVDPLFIAIMFSSKTKRELVLQVTIGGPTSPKKLYEIMEWVSTKFAI